MAHIRPGASLAAVLALCMTVACCSASPLYDAYSALEARPLRACRRPPLPSFPASQNAHTLCRKLARHRVALTPSRTCCPNRTLRSPCAVQEPRRQPCGPGRRAHHARAAVRAVLGDRQRHDNQPGLGHRRCRLGAQLPLRRRRRDSAANRHPLCRAAGRHGHGQL